MQKSIPKENVKRILMINLGGIGDILLSIPALRALRNFYNDAKISILVVPRTIGILKGMGYYDELIDFDFTIQERRGLKAWLNVRKIAKISVFLFSLRKRKFDMVINMRPLISLPGAIKMAVIFSVIGSRYKVGRSTEGRGFFLTHKIYENYIDSMHEIDEHLNLVKILGADTADLNLKMGIFKEDRISIDNFLMREGIQDSDFIIGVNPSAPLPAKRWPIKNFAELIYRLSRDIPCKIIITGSASEKTIAEELEQMAKTRISVASGKTSLGELAALLKRCNLFITNDTGSMHMAAILKTPTVAIFGPADVTRYDPRRIFDKVIVIYKGVDCSPCNKINCKTMKCLNTISVEDVMKAVLELMPAGAK